ncbi:MAG: phenylalanine--tRNA ligase subunit alpha [Candidatus Woesearchaeota archaeon]
MDVENQIKKLHSLERQVLPLISICNSFGELVKISKLQEVEVMRALQWLQNKAIVTMEQSKQSYVHLDVNGEKYASFGLPERQLFSLIEEHSASLKELEKKAGLSREEFSIALGTLRKKAAISIISNNVESTPNKLPAETLEEKFLKTLATPRLISSLKPEEKFAFDELRTRKQIIKVVDSKKTTVTLTELGAAILKKGISDSHIVDRLTHTMLKTGSWKNKNFRAYDIAINVPKVYGGKRHFVKQSIDYAKRVWIELGFQEMEGPMLQTSFWNFDALFTAQDHPVREMQDTFFVKDPASGKLPAAKYVERVRKAHECGMAGSTGWQYKWNPQEARKNVLRTHTTVLSARTLAALKKSDLPAKFFAVGRCFRNEAVDWSHLFEFNQTEGIVVDPDANFRHLLGYLAEFAKKMGFPKVRFRPAHFPYTEPSVEGDVYDAMHDKWIEFIAAGVFRPEVVVPLLGEDIPVLAWGPGLDRIVTSAYKLNDLRDLYSNDINQLKEMPLWLK